MPKTTESQQHVYISIVSSYLHVSPGGIEHVERDVKSDFSRVTFESDEYGVGEPDPSDESQGKQCVTRWRFIQVQYHSGIKHLGNNPAHNVVIITTYPWTSRLR